jgi:uncharacterized RDD family membrane protein YckC
MAKLLIQESAGVREFELVDEEIQIGRELDNALRLSDPSISRHHAMLRRTLAGYEIQDLGSSNGVLVNGARVQSSPLVDSDRITLGQLHMTFVDPRPVEAPASPLGTVRINPAEMAKVHMATPEPLPTEPVASILPKAPVPSRPLPPPPASPFSTLKTPSGEPEATPEILGGRVRQDAMGDNPAPAFLQSWLPPIPDDAQPIMLGDAPERGDFGTRLIAHLLDAVPVVIIFVLFFVVQFIVNLIPVLGTPLGYLLTILEFILLLAYEFVFLPWCWSTYGATPGKKIMKLRVVPEDDATGRIDFKTAFLRLIGHIVNGVIFGLPYLMILGQERKGIQDLLSKSLCIKVDR